MQNLKTIVKLGDAKLGEEYRIQITANDEAWISSMHHGHSYFLAIPYDKLKELMRLAA